MLSATWIKNTKNEWLPLPFNFASVSPSPTWGCYIIWHGGPTPRVVRVGQGDVADRLAAHSHDPVITKYAPLGGLYTTWAAVSLSYRDGVERFLADRLNPLVGDRHPAVIPIPVNLPWAA